MKPLILYILLFNVLFCYNELNYKIKYFGVYAADCKITIKDTVYNDIESKNINFHVKSKGIIKYFFPIENNYSIILGQKNNILFFKKKTTQPRLNNYLESEIRNNKIFYKNTDFEILDNYYNIFSLLYLLMQNENGIPNDFILEREGLLYNGKIIQGENRKYLLLDINSNINSSLNKVIKNTDIFTWGIYMKNAKRMIFLNKENHWIEKCFFSKGIITISAILDSYK